jgi:putative intracellular protease/amidase
VIVPGGFGQPFAQFLNDPLISSIVQGFYKSGRVVGLICHATLLATATDESGACMADGKLMTCWPRTADRVFGALPWIGRYLVPYARPVAIALERAGARVHDRVLTFSRTHAAVDGSLVTARGPWSDAVFAPALLRALAATGSAGGTLRTEDR